MCAIYNPTSNACLGQRAECWVLACEIASSNPASAIIFFLFLFYLVLDFGILL